MKKVLMLFLPFFVFCGCEVEEVNNEDNSLSGYNCVDNQCVPFNDSQYTTLEDCLSDCSVNSIYTGNWNFKGNEFSYSGYYVWDSLMNSEWVTNITINTNYNDSTGSIQLGENVNELIFKYCESCDPIIYNLNDSGLVYSPSLGGDVGWTLTETTFFNIVIPTPPGYSSSYTTVDIEGWKLE